MNKIIKYTVIAAVLLASFKVAGDIDFEERIIVSMSQSDYDEIKDSLQNIHGSSPSDYQIAKEWCKQKGK